MDITRERAIMGSSCKCLTCKHARGGRDPRMDSYRIFCTHPVVEKASDQLTPPCGWDGDYVFYEEGERKTPTRDQAFYDISMMLYDKPKGRILTIFESQIDTKSKLDAIKGLVGDVLSQTEAEVKLYLDRLFDDWGIKQ